MSRRQRRASTSARADHLLATENYLSLNETFYSGSPADYLDMRLNLLVLEAAKPDEVEALFASGLTYKELTVRAPENADDEEEATERRHRLEAAVTIDAEVIYHHAVECLLRLYLGHTGLPPCPPLAIARVKSAGDFKRLVNARFLKVSADQSHEEVAAVLFGAPKREQIHPSPSEELWDTAITTNEGWLRYFASEWLDRANLYNAAKHGLGLVAGPGEVKLDLGPLTLARQGNVISYLEVREVQGRRRWHSSMRFIDVDFSFALTHRAIWMIRCLWEVARARYTGTKLEKIYFLEGPTVSETLRAHNASKPPYQPTGLSEQLAYYQET